MELAMRWHRLLRALAFLAGIAVGLGGAIFIFSNVTPVEVHWRVPSAGGYVLNWTLNGVSVWLIALAPLVIGVAAGYLYHLPARMHHFSEHMRHRSRVHELEHELKELKSSLDTVLMMPEDGTTPVEATLLPARKPEPESEPEPEALPEEPAAAELLAASPAKRRVGRAKLTGVELTQAVPAKNVDRPRRNGKQAAAKRTRPHPKAETEHAAS
jgi:hypothetical protein